MITEVYCIVVTFHTLGTGQSKAFMVESIHSYTPPELIQNTDSIFMSAPFILIQNSDLHLCAYVHSLHVFCYHTTSRTKSIVRSKYPLSLSLLMRTRPHPLHNLRLWLDITNLPTLPTRPRLFIISKLINRILNL
jgi:hypothetical protein